MKTVFIILTILVIAFGVTSPAPAQHARDTDSVDLGPLAEQIEIMRLVLVNSINKSFSSMHQERITAARADRGTDAELVIDPSNPTTLHVALVLRSMYARAAHETYTSQTRGFYADGTGIIFTSEVQTPVKVVDRNADGAPPEPDEWDKAVNEVRRNRGDTKNWFGAADALLAAQGKTEEKKALVAVIDDEFVQTTIDAVLSVLGKHGIKIENLPSDDSIIVALRLTPDHRTTAWHDVDMIDAFGTPLSLTSLYNSRYVTTSLNAEVHHLVITIPKSALNRTSGGNGVDLEALRRAATITQY